MKSKCLLIHTYELLKRFPPRFSRSLYVSQTRIPIRVVIEVFWPDEVRGKNDPRFVKDSARRCHVRTTYAHVPCPCISAQRWCVPTCLGVWERACSSFCRVTGGGPFGPRQVGEVA